METAFSNYNSNVFVLQLPKEVDKGSLMARYSRSPKGMRQIYTDEFLDNKNRGESFYKRVLLEYGDDSVAELGKVQIGIEDISNIAAQFIEDSRIGMSFLEKSSRYVELDSFYTPTNLGDLTELYEDHCKMSLSVYKRTFNEINKYLREQFPEESLNYDGVKNPTAVYNATIKAKTLDLTRGLLPASILTNLGITGNARAFEYLILKMKASNNKEISLLGEQIHSELNTVIEPFLERIDSPYGQDYQKYLRKLNSRIENELAQHIYELKESSDKALSECDTYYNNYVKCLESDVPLISEIHILTNMFYEVADTNLSFEAIKNWIKALTINQRRKMLSSIMHNLRQNRRHRLPRAFENCMWRFEIVSSYAVYRDLHRHRLLTFHRQRFNPNLGYYIPKEIKKIDMHKDFIDTIYNATNVYSRLHSKFPLEAQYCLNFAFNYRYQLYVNLRELAHLIELRTIPQGNPEYRLICQKMYEEVKNRSKHLAQYLKFVDTNEYPLERLKSEIRKERKLNG